MRNIENEKEIKYMEITLPNRNENITLKDLQGFLKHYFNIELYNIKNNKKPNVSYARKVKYNKLSKRIEVIFIDKIQDNRIGL